MSNFLIDVNFHLNALMMKMLNQLCDDFIQKVGIFDEIAILQISNEGDILYVYDYSYRNAAKLTPISQDEVKVLFPIIEKLTVGEWSYITTAKGADFDLVYKMTPRIFLLINNTEMSIDEIQQEWGQESFDQAKLDIDTFLEQACTIVRGAIEDN